MCIVHAPRPGAGTEAGGQAASVHATRGEGRAGESRPDFVGVGAQYIPSPSQPKRPPITYQNILEKTTPAHRAAGPPETNLKH